MPKSTIDSKNPTFGDAIRAATGLFGRMIFGQQRSNPVCETIITPSWSTSGEGRDIWSDEDYINVYRRAPWVYACCNAVADDISKLKLEVVMPDGETVPEPWPEQLQVLVQPNKTTTIKDLLRAYTIDEQLLGEAYANWRGDEILWMPSFKTRVVADPKKCIKGYELESNGVKTWFEPEEVAYLKRGAPDLIVEGMSHLTPLSDTLIQMAARVRYSKGFWSNDARPSGLLITEQRLDPDTRREMLSEWMTLYGGSGNAGKTAMLSNGLKYEPMGQTNEEAQFSESHDMSVAEILAVFNVPPVRVGLLEHASYANAVEQMAMYWGSTILPLAERIAATFEATIFAGTGFKLRFSADHIDALTIAKERLFQIATSACGNRAILTQNESRLLVGYPPHDDPKADELNVAAPAFPGAPFSGGSEEDPEDSEEMEDFEESTEEEIGEEVRCLSADQLKMRAMYIKEAAQQRVARHHIALDRETEICARDVAIPLLERMEAENLKAINADLRKYGPRTITASDRPPDIPLPSTFDAELKEDLKSFLLGTFERVVEEEQAGLNQLKRNLRQFAKDKSRFETRDITVVGDFGVVDPAVMEAIEKRTVQISTVPKHIQEMVRKTISDGVARGATIQQMADDIRELFSGLRQSQATTIARTEAGSGTNEAAHLAQSQAGVTKKAWSQANAGQDKRANHTINENAGEILFAYRFPGNGMLYPQESGFPAGETINCMCVSYATDFE